ncbi:rhomboid family intramembrane serine protease [Flavobacterium sp. I3-2]|uniref:rhomboid family intramembrane serine protease n=1 Tax=Flavobacterium sp. I3-2 TaxID=2748319 RepID=UPI0015A82415|nr:rhomboid family intramembrane serine protease [Flavobacterium sp. I3-2]
MPITNVVKQLLIINIILFGATYFVPVLTEYFALYYFENPLFRFWQILTHMFMHGSVLHIFFNMFALYSFGSTIEHFWGGKKFLFFYISCGLGAAVLHTAVNYYQVNTAVDILVSNGFTENSIFEVLNSGRGVYNTNWTHFLSQSQLEGLLSSYNVYAVGASGAIYGLLVAFAVMFPNAELALMFIPIPIKAKYFVPAILLYDLYSGFNGGAIFGTSTGVAHFAHLGGALMGFIMVLIWKKNQFNNMRWDS